MVSSKCISLAFVLSTLISRCVAAKDEQYYTQSQLLDELLQDYDKTSLPSPKVGIPVNVTLGIAVTQIVKVDEKTEGMNLNVWYRMKWKDYRLVWDSKKYKNVTSMTINSDYLWTPDIVLTKPISSDGGQVLGTTKDEADLSWKILLLSDGTASFNFPGIINGQCPLNIANYPFDEHKCSFTFTSWVHDGLEINLALREGNALDFDNYVLNNEWHILGSDAKQVDMKYVCCDNIYKTVVFYINIKRGASSYVSNYIIPSILIIILSLMMFTLPPEVGKRMEIGINLLLCLSVYLTILNTKMPTRSDVFPLLSKFYGCCIFILTIALLCTCWVVAYYFHDMSGWKIYEMPEFVQIGVLYYLGRVLGFSNVKKVSPSNISIGVGDEKKIIIVKPGEKNKEQENFGVKDTKNRMPKNERKKSVNQDEDIKNEKRVTIKIEPKNEKNSNSPTADETKKIKKDNVKDVKDEKDIKDIKDVKDVNVVKDDKDVKDVKDVKDIKDVKVVKDKEKKGIIIYDGNDNQEKIKNKKKTGKVSTKEDVKSEGINSEKPESIEMKEKRHKVAKDNPALKNTFVKNENKVLPNTEDQTTKEKTTTSPDDKVTVQIEKSSKTSLKDISKNGTSKKTNRVFANTISSGFVETKRKPIPNAKDAGVVNEGADLKDAAKKETENKDVEKENVEMAEADPQKSVREPPFLLNNTGVLDKLNVGCFDKKTTDDSDFEEKQNKKKKKHESIKWLSELAEYYADHLQRKKNRYQWRQAAIVLNRLFTILLFVSIVFSIIAVILAR